MKFINFILLTAFTVASISCGGSKGGGTTESDTSDGGGSSTTAPILASIADQSSVSVYTEISVDANDISGGDTDSNGDTITYTCVYDTTNDGTVNPGTACATLGATYNSSTGQLSWTPEYDQTGTYEFKITATDGSEEDDEIFLATIVDPQLKLYYTFDAADIDLVTNNKIYDSTGTYDADTNGTFASYASGIKNEALQFNGSDTFLSVPDFMDIFDGASNWTISVWLYTNLEYKNIIGHSTTSLWIWTGENYDIGFNSYFGSGLLPAYTEDISDTWENCLVQHDWTQLVIARDGASIHVYKNGTLFHTLNATDSTNGTIGGTFQIGKYSNVGCVFNGYMDNFFYHARTLSATEIQSRYNRDNE